MKLMIVRQPSLKSPLAWTGTIPSTGGDGKDEATTSNYNTKSGWLLSNSMQIVYYWLNLVETKSQKIAGKEKFWEQK